MSKHDFSRCDKSQRRVDTGIARYSFEIDGTNTKLLFATTPQLVRKQENDGRGYIPRMEIPSHTVTDDLIITHNQQSVDHVGKLQS